MSKNFFYDYKEVLAGKLEKKYKNELLLLAVNREKQKQLDNAQKKIEDYYNILATEMKDTIEVSNGDILIMSTEDVFLRMTMFGNYVKFSRLTNSIEVEIGEFDPVTDIVEANIDSNIIPSDKKCIVKKIGKVHDGSHFDERTISYYMNKAFGELKELQ